MVGYSAAMASGNGIVTNKIRTPSPLSGIKPLCALHVQTMGHEMEKRLITASAVRAMLGGVSDMSLWRWLADPTLDFPRPIRIASRRYWREAEIIAWIDMRAAARAGEAIADA